ncbi:hypothetical protein JKF63_03252 [Porcisia hertigi]|uniref:1-phosphatidylinositol-3-phosphate 5-kinase n=1 Tax=Porcisia hertigi TaxID=2761500 RepID=A0A836L7M6_9TRYP|nr:hypothetical protein JKF63_03252 [Porcisia hertigi]
MSTDRSLWVDDKYALRCRGCGMKFTVFRRRHHCRRCGQVFCYECLNPPLTTTTTTPQSIASNLYQWLAPSSTTLAKTPASIAAPQAAGKRKAAGDSRNTPSTTTTTTTAAAELSMRLCRRCAATVTENAARETSVTHAEFESSLLTANSTTQLVSNPPSPLRQNVSHAPVSPLKLDKPHRFSDGSFSEETRLGTARYAPPRIETARRSGVKNSPVVPTTDSPGSPAPVHSETEEEREVTYSIGRVRRPQPSIMSQWWAAHQRALNDKPVRTFVKHQANLPTSNLESVGVFVRTLSDPIDFGVHFLFAEDMMQPLVSPYSGVVGSAAMIQIPDAPASLRELLKDCGAACTDHLELRIQNALKASPPHPPHTSSLWRHFADIAWHVVRHTAVALGANILDHTSIMSIPVPAQLTQCVVYPGLVNHRRLPSKRVMSPSDNPRVLLLAGHLSYPVQPSEDLVDYVRSYGGYLDKLFQRLETWHPDVMVVEGGVHHYLRKRIEEEGQMRLVADVGRDFLVQLSWCLRADIIADLQYVGVGDLATTAPLGHCARFEVLELAEEVHCCAFRGFDALSFHTLILRGDPLSRSVAEHEDQCGVWPRKAMEKVLKGALSVAHHLALQANSAAALLCAGLPVSLGGAAATREEAAASTGITMNLGCRFPLAVQSAYRDASNPEALSLVRDTMVFNVVHMDQLFEGAGSSSGGSVVMSTLAKTRNSELSLMHGVSCGSLNLSQCGSRFDLLASSVVSASSTATPQATPFGRAEAPAAHAYAVVQQKLALTFYGAGDETLFHFLVNRCAGTESQVLYLHGTHRVKMTTSTTASLPSAASTLAESGLAGVLCTSQKAAFHRITARQSAARALATAEAHDACTMAAFLAQLKGYFSLRIRAFVNRSRVGAADALIEADTSVDAKIDVCSPHLLNMSTGAFFEWVLYGWVPALSTQSAQPTLEMHFQYNSLDIPAQQQPPNATTAHAYANAVTFLVEAVHLSRIEYPLSVMPSAVLSPAAKHPTHGVVKGIDDDLYAGHGVEEMEGLLTELQHATLTALDRMERLENARAGEPTGAFPRSTTQDMEEKTRASDGPPSMPTAENVMKDLRHLSEDVQSALSALRDAHRRGPPEEVALLLADMRRHRFPALLVAYRNWNAAHWKVASKIASSTPTDAAAATVPECPSYLRRLDGCLYHKDRSQWIRLTEPSSILSAALLSLYHPSPRSTLRTTSSTMDAGAATESELALPAGRDAAAVAAPSLDMGSAAQCGHPQLLSMVSQLSPAAALEVLRRSAGADGAFPMSLKCTLSGYQWVAQPGIGGPAGLTGGAMSISSAASVASMIGAATGNAEPTIRVDVLFPCSFAALQVLYTDGAPFDICAALARCHPFSADGGKSHSMFFVTQDERFLIKSVKPTELRHFREWAPRYFASMADHYASLRQQQTKPFDPETSAQVFAAQSTLGKILGLYAVHVQGSRSRASVSPVTFSGTGPNDTAPQLRSLLTDGTHCFMVAEQLLFQRPVRETWDLKGSQRNRTTVPNAAVRLDVDLVRERLRMGNFFFCTPEAKMLLMSHLHRDTAMLADSSIMDYSLMVSAGSDKVFVGMIDFLHPYSSAKVLESKMKSGLDTMLGYTRRDPTIIDPASYAARFMLWMDGYFNGVPDRLFPLICARLLEDPGETALVEKGHPPLTPPSSEVGKA